MIINIVTLMSCIFFFHRRKDDSLVFSLAWLKYCLLLLNYFLCLCFSSLRSPVVPEVSSQNQQGHFILLHLKCSFSTLIALPPKQRVRPRTSRYSISLSFLICKMGKTVLIIVMLIILRTIYTNV